MTAADELMHANLIEVFNERDETRRRHAINRTYTESIRWVDDEGVTIGRGPLEAKCIALQSQLGELQFREAGPVSVLTGFAYLAWHLVAADGGEPVMSGFDVALIEGDRIAQLFTVLTPPQP